MSQPYQGDIFEGVKVSVEPKPQSHGPPNALNNNPHFYPHLNTHHNGITNPSHAIQKSAYQYNVNQHQTQSQSQSRSHKKIRLIIPRKRKLQEIQNNNPPKPKSSSDCIPNNPNPNPNANVLVQPPQKKQRLSSNNPPTFTIKLPTFNYTSTISMNNQLLPSFPQQNHIKNDNEINESPILHKPQPPSPSPTPPLPISTTINDHNTDIQMQNNDSTTTNISLPPPPPLQSISPPPPSKDYIIPKTQINPYLSLQSQLATHFQWPSHNPQGIAYTHICDQCGQGFMTGNALGGHKGRHRKAKQRAIRQRMIQQNHKNNQYYYPNNSKNTLAPPKLRKNMHKTSPINNMHYISGSEHKKRKIKRKPDTHNQRDVNGDFPTHDVEGNVYSHVCEKCGKGFNTGSSLGGHRSVHKRMERMGKIYNKLSGKHEYPSGYNPPKKVPLKQAVPRSFMRPQTVQNGKKIENEYSGLNNTEIMYKIMDKLEVLDVDKLFIKCDRNEEYTQQVSELLSFDVIRAKIKGNKYISVQQDFLADLNKLFRFVFKVYDNAHERCKMALKLKQFAYRQTMDAMVHVVQQNNNNSSSTSSSSSLLSLPNNTNMHINNNGLTCIQMDGYEAITDYEFFCDDEVLSEKMSCKKKVSCDGKCCHDLHNLGPYCIHEEKWQSSCECRSAQMECTDECKCDPLQCKNRQIGDKCFKNLNESIREQQVFGIDQHTRMCIEKVLPKKELKEIYGEDMDGKSYFIEDLLLPAINNYLFFIMENAQYKSKYDASLMVKHTECEANFMFSDVLRSMLYEAEFIKKNVNLCRILSYILRLILNMGYDELSNEISSIDRSKRRIKYDVPYAGVKYFLDLYLNSDLDVSGEDIICHREFPIYSKGRGVICIDKDKGIVKNEYIISFLGVVYSPWCWYEKDDRTRWLVKSRGAQCQQEFFNIMMEKHRDDIDGYDLMFVDPSKKGNYGSRLSHSCAPNCISVSMGVGGKYNIAVYAAKNIKYGQELCFNYNSVTENEQEWQDAICLCGSAQCHGQFLIYAGTQLYTQILKKKHHLLHRTANLFNSNYNESKMDENELNLLKKYSLGKSALSGIPQWIIKYAIFVLQYIDYEQKELPKELLSLAQNNERGYSQFISFEAAKEESVGLKYVRLSNLVITLNKMNLFFRHPPNKNVMQFPLFKLYSTQDLIHKIWFEPNSIIQDLYLFIAIYEGDQHIILHKINEFRHKLPDYYNCPNGIEISREYLLCIRDLLLLVAPKHGAYHHAAADILLFYASTRYFFYFYPPYQGFQSRVFTYGELGYENNNNSNNNNNKSSYPPPKKYNQQYVWGQLNFWERHTIESPDSSLSAERRGTICLPNIKCCYINYQKYNYNFNKKKLKLYNYQVRKQLIKHLKYQHYKPWSGKWHFAFKNGQLYGSPWLDLYIDPINQTQKFEKFLQIMKETKMIYPDGTYCTIQSDLDVDDNIYINKNECKTNSTNPKHLNIDKQLEKKQEKQEEKKENESEKKPKRRSNRLRGKTPKQSYVEPKI